MQAVRVFAAALVVSLFLVAGSSIAAPKNAELIVGKWDIGMNTIMEYKKDGGFVMTVGNVVINGKYKFISDDTIDIEIMVGDKAKSNKLKIAIKDDEMTTTDPDGKMNKLKRVK
jgi:uncharacterized protein (TIGR03066 family)